MKALLDRFSGKKVATLGAGIGIFTTAANTADTVVERCFALGCLAFLMGCFVVGQAYQDAHAKSVKKES